MGVASLRSLVSSFAPGGLLLLGTVILLQQGLLLKSLGPLIHIYPYTVAAAGVFFGWRFKRGRLIFAVIILAIAERSLLQFASGASSAKGVGLIVHDAVSLLLPLNLAILSMLRERGVLTLRGLWRLTVIFSQVVAVTLLCRYRDLGYAEWLDHAFLPLTFLPPIRLGQPALLVFAGAFLIACARSFRCRTALESGFLWALISIFFGLAMARSDTELQVFFATAGLVLVASVIETSYRMAFGDELTGLPGRRALNEELVRLGNRYTVAMIDIDFFKKFNDRFGHDVGDQALKMVASKLREVRGGGKAFRYGGEEFTVIFSRKSLDEALPHLEKVRKAVEGSRFTVRGRGRPRKKAERAEEPRGSRHRVVITVSIGAAERDDGNATPDQVIQAADKALYRAKQAGRNRVST
jgi:diguanylate cyclase (GGDEF)-like protein